MGATAVSESVPASATDLEIHSPVPANRTADVPELESPTYSEDEFNDFVEEDDAEDEEDDPVLETAGRTVADLWDGSVECRSKWPPSCGSDAPTKRSETPTTRPPSQGSVPQS